MRPIAFGPTSYDSEQKSFIRCRLRNHTRSSERGLSEITEETGHNARDPRPKSGTDFVGIKIVLARQLRKCCSFIRRNLALATRHTKEVDEAKMSPGAVPQIFRNKNQTMPQIEISINGILKLLYNLKPGKAVGPDKN